MPDPDLTLRCAGCKADFPVGCSSINVPAKGKEEIGAGGCPQCQKKVAPAPMELGCPLCRASLWVVAEALGQRLACPHCNCEIALPSREDWGRMATEKAQFQWEVLSGGETQKFAGLETLLSAIVGGTVKGGDLCQVHAFAPVKPLKQFTDEHFALRRLYDPAGAWAERGGQIGGAVFIAAYLVAHVVGGISAMGSAYLLTALFGILAVALTPTVIGLGIVYVIAAAMGIPLFGAYIGVILAALIGVGVFLLGRLMGKGIARVIVAGSGGGSRRQVSWDNP